MPQAYFFLFFGGVFCLVNLLFHGPAQYRKNMSAILQPLSAQILLDISVLYPYSLLSLLEGPSYFLTLT